MNTLAKSQSNVSALSLVTIVTVTHNSAHCMKSLSTHIIDFPEIVIVDNASKDNLIETVKQKLPHAKLIQLPRNMGFGHANNVALRLIKTPYALLLNPDCLIDAENVKNLLKSALEYPDAALLAPQIIRPNGKLEVSYRWSSKYWVSRGAAADGPCSVGFVTGACMLLRMSAFKSIGFFDEQFFLYYEDEDLCERVFQAKANVLLIPQAIATHASRSSVKEGFPWSSEYVRGFHHAQSKLIFQLKHRQKQNVSRLRLSILILSLLTLPLRLMLFRAKYTMRLIGRISGIIFFRYKPSANEQ